MTDNVIGLPEQLRQKEPPGLDRLTLDQVRSPPPLWALWGSLFVRGKVAILWGPTYIGKSAFLAGLVFSAAAGLLEYLGIPLQAPFLESGGHRVLIVSYEDDRDDWCAKAGAVLAEWKALWGEVAAECLMERALQHVWVVDRSGGGVVRLSEMVQERRSDNRGTVTRVRPSPTEERENIIRAVEWLQPTLTVVETVSHLVDEETNPEFAGLGVALTEIAQFGYTALLTSHHSTKVAAKDGDDAIENVRGGYALVANVKGGVVSLFPADPKTYDPRAAVNEVILRQQKGPPRVRPMAPLMLVRLGYEGLGAVFRLPREVAADPKARAAAEERAKAKRRRNAWLFAKVYDVAAAMLQAGERVSSNRLRAPLREAKVPGKNDDLDKLVTQAVTAGVLRVPPDGRDSMGRILRLELGKRPALDGEAAEVFAEEATRDDRGDPGEQVASAEVPK